MTRKRIILFISILAILSFIIIPSTAISSNELPTKATLNRFPDPILIKAETLPAMIGGPLEKYRVYASQNGSLDPIRFQIDEMTDKGDFIFPHGKKNNKKQSNGILDPRDVLLFMAHDAGDRVQETEWPKNISKGIEIAIADPINQTKAWAYMFLYDKNPPERSTRPHYFTFDYDTNTLYGEYWKATYIITKDGKRTTFYNSQASLPKAGGTGENYADRLKIRANIKAVFGNVAIKLDEENMESNVLAWIQGPVRVIKRVEQYAKGPFNMKLARFISDVQYYETMATVPVNVNVPFKLDSFVTSVVLTIGTDYSPVVKDSMFYSSSNPKGILINGKMGETDKNFNPEPDTWRVMTGKWGALMTRNIFTENLKKYLDIKVNIIDDETVPSLPEDHPGCIGYIYQAIDIGGLPRGNYTFYLEFYTPPNYTLGNEKAYLNYLDNPLDLKIGENSIKNQVKLFGMPGKSF